MNERPYKEEHLQEYKGILISHDYHNGNFKMELKVEDNSVLDKSVEKIESSVELEFYYNLGLSTLFFHDIHRCPLRDAKNEHCYECKNIKEIHKTLKQILCSYRLVIHLSLIYYREYLNIYRLFLSN